MKKWKVKAKIVRVAHKIPLGGTMYYFYQKYISKSIVNNDNRVLELYRWKVLEHLKKIHAYGRQPIEQAVFFEFGAGWDLLAPIGVSLIANNESSDEAKFRYVCVDINKFMRPAQIYKTLEHYCNLKEDITSLCNENNLPYSIRRGIVIDKTVSILKFLENDYGIIYKAPCDAGKTNMEGGCVDYIISNTTLQHIPTKDVKRICRECYRLLKQGGIFTLNVSYMDHYTNFDKSITVFNFLQYSDKEWEKYNPSMHYQNRMRHSDYEKIFLDCGFEIIENEPRPLVEGDIQIIKNMHIDEKFKKYSIEDLAIRQANFVLRKG